MKRIAIILDVGPQIGYGHLSRSFSLIRALRHRGAEVSVVAPPIEGHWAEKLQDEKVRHLPLSAPFAFEREDGAALTSACEELKAEVAFVDHYRVSPQHLCQLTATHTSVWRIDDLGEGPYSTERIVSPLPFTGHGEGHLLGPRFAFVDQAYLERRKEAELRTSLHRVLVSFGGSDPSNLTGIILAALARAEVKIKVDVVLGPGYQHHASLREMKYKRALDVTFHEAPPNLVDLIAAADLAIGSPGHTSWERCSLGLPALLITQAKNQEKVGQFMQLNGAAELLGTSAGNTEPLLNHHLGALLHDPSLLHKMSHSAYHLVDAQGPARVADCMLGLTLRPTEIGDAKMIFGWINDPTTRKQSMQHRPVELGSHIEWLSNALQDKARRLLIAEVDGQPVGQCRFDSIGAQVRISFLVSPAYRGRRIARPMLNAAILLNDLEGELRAEVRTGNLPSLAVFRGLLFSEGSPDPAGTIIFTRAQIQP